MNPNQERWAEALAVERMYGDAAPRWIAERIGALALAGDIAGVRRMQEIALRLGWLTGSYDDVLALQQPYAGGQMTMRGPLFPTRDKPPALPSDL